MRDIKRNVFRTLDDMKNSALWNGITGGIPKQSSRILRSTRLEDVIYDDLHDTIDNGLHEIEQQGTEKLDTFPSLIRDIFQSVYSIKPRRTDEDTLTAHTRLFNKTILDLVMDNDEYHVLKSICEGRDLPAYEAIMEFSNQIFEKLDELLGAANKFKDYENKRLLDLISKLESQLEQLANHASVLQSAHNNGDLSDETEKQLLRAANNVADKKRQIDMLSGMASDNIRKAKPQFQAVIAAAVEAAKAKAEETSVILSSWGSEGSNLETVKHNAELLERVRQNDKISRIAKYLGKYRELLENTRKNCYAFGRGDKYDITLGNDFTRAVSSEYAYLALPETVPLFIQKVQRKALKQYRKRELVTKGYGDVVICLDESGSMTGDPIAWGKALALTLVEAANRNGRDCAIIRFSGAGAVAPHYFMKGKFTVDDVLYFADSFMGGGTDFTGPLEKAAEIIETSSFRNADIVFLTDGICGVTDEFVKAFNDKRATLNFSVTGILMDIESAGLESGLEPFCDKIYRLGEIASDDVAGALIRKLA